jgi:hypothetical protein
VDVLVVLRVQGLKVLFHDSSHAGINKRTDRLAAAKMPALHAPKRDRKKLPARIRSGSHPCACAA